MMMTIKKLMGCVLLIAVATICSGYSGKLVAAYDFMFPEYETRTIQHIVERGDTYWSIAETYYPMEQKECFQQFRWQLRESNKQLHSSKRFLQPGDVVLVEYNTIRQK